MRVKKLKLQKGVKIKAEKGLNFPDSNFKIDILTEKDKEDLDLFVIMLILLAALL